MDWIRTDIDIGVRIKCFELNYYTAKNKFDFNKRFDLGNLTLLFSTLLAQGYFPVTSQLVRISMPPDKMAICFWVQDSSFEPVEQGATIERKELNIKQND